MKKGIVSGILLLLFVGCAQNSTISGTHELVLSEQDLQELGLSEYPENLQELGIVLDDSGCRTEEYETSEQLAQYTICSYTINSLSNTEVIIELKKFANLQALNGSYQYESSHLLSSEGIISQNTFGDQSRFSVNTEEDYGGKLNPQEVYFYHLWFTKNMYLVHVTSSGSDAQEQVAEIGRRILIKF